MEYSEFSDGQSVPEGYAGLTDGEFTLLDAMTPKERSAWYRENGKPVEVTVDEIAGDPSAAPDIGEPAPAGFVLDYEDQCDMIYGRLRRLA